MLGDLFAWLFVCFYLVLLMTCVFVFALRFDLIYLVLLVVCLEALTLRLFIMFIWGLVAIVWFDCCFVLGFDFTCCIDWLTVFVCCFSLCFDFAWLFDLLCLRCDFVFNLVWFCFILFVMLVCYYVILMFTWFWLAV